MNTSHIIPAVIDQAHRLNVSALKAAITQMAKYGEEHTLDALLDTLMHRLPSSEFVLFINSIH